MSSSAASNNKSDSIDFEFFESESCNFKSCSKQKKSASSKIVTKAIIETNPTFVEFDGSNINEKSSELNRNRPTSERLTNSVKRSECLSSPSSSLENKLLGLNAALDEALINCLAYNDEGFNSQDLSPTPSGLSESDDSPVSSTVTTITSDFTSISPLSFSSLSSSTCNVSNDHDENNAVCQYSSDIEKPDADEPWELTHSNHEIGTDNANEELDGADEPSIQSCQDNDQTFDSFEGMHSPEAYESDFESDTEIKHPELQNDSTDSVGLVKTSEKNCSIISDKESNVTTLEYGLSDISLSQSRSSSVKTSYKKQRKNYNLTFNREEIMRIERDNLILLKKIMAYSKNKPTPLMQHQPVSQKKSSTAINRARLQKKIDQDNYILYSKISAMSRTKKVY